MIVHILSQGQQFIGQTKNNRDDKIIYLKKACSIVYYNENGQVMRQIKSLDKDSDYFNGGDLPVYNGPGVFVFQVSKNGVLAEQYNKTVSVIEIPKMNVPADASKGLQH